MNTHNSQGDSGFAHVILIIIAVLVVAGIAFAGWRVMTMQQSSAKSDGTGASAAQAAATQTRCMAQFQDSVFCKFAATEEASPIEKGSFAVSLTGNNNGTPSTINFQQDGKGNTSMTMSGDGSPSEEFATYNGTQYMREAGQGTWISVGAGAPTQEPSSPSSDLSFLGSLITVKITKLGTEACGNLTCYKYQFSDSAQPGATQYLWFDNQQYLLREYKTSGSELMGALDMKLSYPHVTIAQPSPVQSLSASLGQ